MICFVTVANTIVMNLKLLLGMCIVLFSCEKAYHNTNKITGVWKLTVEMYDNELLIGEIAGDIIFYADHTAKLQLNEADSKPPINYQWYQQPVHLILINQDTKFPLPYYIISRSSTHIEMSQTEDVKMKLFR